MKVMFIQLPHFYDGAYRPPTSYPLGIGYLVSALKGDFELIPMDLWIDNSNIDEALKRINMNQCDVFCISVYSTQYVYFKELVDRLKDAYPHKKIIAGGPGATFSYKIFLEKTKLDFCVIGEGEITLSELLKNLDSPELVKGLAFKKNGIVTLTEKREQIKNLDTLLLPDRDFFDLERYILANKAANGPYKGLRAVNIIAGRGCPYQCTYCSKTFSGCRLRSVHSIMEELALIKSKYQLDAIEFNDELVVINKERILKLCSGLKKLDIAWGCQGRINLVDKEILGEMKKAGCMYIGYGVESYSQEILDRMNKKINVNDIIPVINLTRKVGLLPIVQYMFGFPGENDSTIKKTIYFFKKIKHQYIGFTTTPLPGTELYNQAIKEGKITNEEYYISKLDSGYNRFKPLVNLTNFSDLEFVKKKKKLMETVNNNYRIAHPFLTIKEIIVKKSGIVIRLYSIIKLLVLHPHDFFKKLNAKLNK